MKAIRIKRVLLAVIAIIVLFLSLIGALFAWYVFNDKPPEFFPLDDQHASYTILYSPIGNTDCDNRKQILENSPSSDNRFVVRYEGKNIFNGLGEINCFDINIGKSKQNLEVFIGKEVKVKGELVTSDKQCIQKKCKNISGPYVVLDIDEISLSN